MRIWMGRFHYYHHLIIILRKPVQSRYSGTSNRDNVAERAKIKMRSTIAARKDQNSQEKKEMKKRSGERKVALNKRDAKKTPMSVGTGTGHSIIQKSHHSLPIPGPQLQKSPSTKSQSRGSKGTGIRGRRERRLKRKYNARCTAKSRRRMEGGPREDGGPHPGGRIKQSNGMQSGNADCSLIQMRQGGRNGGLDVKINDE